MINKLLNYKFSFFNYQISGKKVVAHPLFSGSAFMIIGTNIANFIGYLYHLIIGRLLGPASYGELAATISLIGLFTISFNFLATVIIKFISSSKEKDYENLLSWFFQKALILGVLISCIVLLTSPWISRFIKVELKVIYIIAPILFFSICILVLRSFLQGLVKFKLVAFLTGFEMFLRLVSGIMLIKIGLSVFGATLGILIAIICTLFIARLTVKKYRLFSKNYKIDKVEKIIVYTIPIFISSLAFNSFFSTDLLLVKHFFNSHDAGIYAAISVLGKIIFFGTAPVASVMFPMVSKRQAKGYGYKKIFLMSLFLVIIGAFLILLIYYLFPEIMVEILYGKNFIEAANNLVWFGLFMTIFSITSVFISYFLALNKTIVSYFVALFALVQVIGIWFLHNSILQVITISIISISILLLILLLFFTYESKKIINKSI